MKTEWNPTNDSIRDTVTAAKNLSRGINPEESELLRLNQVVLQEGQKILDGMIGNPDVNTVKVNITRMWGNDGLNNDIAIPHVHRDSFLSAVYYPKADEGSIHFYSPWNDAILTISLLEELKIFMSIIVRIIHLMLKKVGCICFLLC